MRRKRIPWRVLIASLVIALALLLVTDLPLSEGSWAEFLTGVVILGGWLAAVWWLQREADRGRWG